MSTSLIEWLYIDDSADSSKQGALIMFPRMINRWNVAALMVSKWESHKVVIVTNYSNEFMKSSVDISGTKWTDLELIPFPLVSYSDIDGIRKYLNNTEIDIIIFDDARMLATIMPALDFSTINAKIIVLSTWGDTMTQLDTVTSKLPELKLASLNLLKDNTDISWQTAKVKLSDRQIVYYDLVRSYELKADSKISYPLTRMLTLYSYPDNIMKDTLVVKTICETDQISIPDKLESPNTWLKLKYLKSLADDGPKLLSIIDGVIAEWPSKQLIITRFNNRYGVDLIKSFFQLMIRNKLCPYDISEIFSSSCTDDYETSLNYLHKFNNSNSGVMITNISPFIPLKDVAVIHLADTYSFLTLSAILDRCHKRHLSKDHSLVVYSHIATHPQEKSSDEALHELFTKSLADADKLYYGLITSASSIVFDSQIGLVVK